MPLTIKLNNTIINYWPRTHSYTHAHAQRTWFAGQEGANVLDHSLWTGWCDGVREWNKEWFMVV